MESVMKIDLVKQGYPAGGIEFSSAMNRVKVVRVSKAGRRRTMGYCCKWPIVEAHLPPTLDLVALERGVYYSTQGTHHVFWRFVNDDAPKAIIMSAESLLEIPWLAEMRQFVAEEARKAGADEDHVRFERMQKILYRSVLKTPPGEES